MRFRDLVDRPPAAVKTTPDPPRRVRRKKGSRRPVGFHECCAELRKALRVLRSPTLDGELNLCYGDGYYRLGEEDRVRKQYGDEAFDEAAEAVGWTKAS